MNKEKYKFHYLYKITRDGGRFYVGIHSTNNLDDGYFGSGTILLKSIKKHGKESHSMEIMEFLPDRDLLELREYEVVNEELLKNPLCMNIKRGGEGGGPTWDRLSEQSRANQMAALQKRNSLPLSDSHKKNIGNSNRGKVRTKETCEKISLGSKNRDKSTYVGRPQKGSVWMNNGYERKFVLESKVPEMEALGFKKGYVLNRTDETL